MTSEDPFNTPEKKYKRDSWFTFAQQRKTKNTVQNINYLTFPGINCHDIIKLKSLLKTTPIGYDKESLTFIEKGLEAITDIRDKLPGARFYPGFFEDFVKDAWDGRAIQRPPSVELTNYFEFFPYDVINLDFTGSAFYHEDRPVSPQMAAINTLFELQSLKHKSFTLFLTFSGVRWKDDDRGRDEVNNAIHICLDNEENSQFKTKFNEIYRGGSPYYSVPENNHRALTYKDFLLVGIPIIIINYGFSKNFNVSCKKRFCYKGEGNRAIMVSFIFDCEFVDTSSYDDGSISHLITLKPIKLGEIFDHKEDINQLFLDNPELKNRYQ